MTVRELINAFTTKNIDQKLLDLELLVVTSAETIDGEKFPDNPGIKGELLDGSTLIRSKPIKSVIFGHPGFLIFIDRCPESEKQTIFPENLESFPQVAVYGPVPDPLKW